MLKIAPFTLSEVGRILRSLGEKSFFPRTSPAMTLKKASLLPFLYHIPAAFSPQQYDITNARYWQAARFPV
jgi:hypothetical protein